MTIQPKTDDLSQKLGDDSEIVCGCASLTIGNMRAEIKSGALSGFDELISRTGAGKSCTACLLDLEYFYTALASYKRSELPRESSSINSISKLPFKRRIYGILDKVGPMVPYRLEGVAPIIIGAEIEQRLIVSCHSLLFKNDIVAPPVTYFVSIFNAEGRFLRGLKQRIGAGNSWRKSVSEIFSEESRTSDQLSVGLMKIKWSFSYIGKRGTTRPQIEVNTRSGSCAVHTQRAGSAREKWVTLNWQPNDQRIFISVVNPSPQTLVGKITYPFLQNCKSGADCSHSLSITPNGASITEIILDKNLSDIAVGKSFSIKAVFNNVKFKMHVICASSNLDRLSIDHL